MTALATAPITQPAPSAEPRERRRTRRSRPGLLALPALLWLTAFIVVPSVVLGSHTFLTSGFFTVSLPATLENFRTAVSSELTRGAALNSLIIGAGSAVTCLVIGIPAAYWLRYHAGRLVAPVMLIVRLSMFASYLVRIYAWRTILGERGVLNSTLSNVIAAEVLKVEVAVRQGLPGLPIASAVGFAGTAPASGCCTAENVYGDSSSDGVCDTRWR